MVDEFTIPIMRIPTILSIGINLFFFIRWIRSKLNEEIFMTGVWHGTLRPTKNHNSEILECTMIIVRHDKRRNTGFLFYQRRDAAADQTVLTFGFDKLLHYESNWNSYGDRTWSPTFVRSFHKVVGVGAFEREVEFPCTVKVLDLWFRARVEFTSKLCNGEEWKGQMEKA